MRRIRNIPKRETKCNICKGGLMLCEDSHSERVLKCKICGQGIKLVWPASTLLQVIKEPKRVNRKQTLKYTTILAQG